MVLYWQTNTRFNLHKINNYISEIMNLRQILTARVVTHDEIQQAQKTLVIEGLGSASPGMIIGEMAIQKITCETIGQCLAYLGMSQVLLEILPTEVLDAELDPGSAEKFIGMVGAQAHLQAIISESR